MFEDDEPDLEGLALPEGDDAGVVLSALTGHVMACWREAKDAKHDVEQRMLQAVRQREGNYSPEKLAAIKSAGMSELFLKITGVKCRAAEAALRNTLLPVEDKPWTLEPTPLPDLPDELDFEILQYAIERGLSDGDLEDLKDAVKDALAEDAKTRAVRMERVCEDQQVEGGFRAALRDMISDIVTLGTCVMKAPVIKMKPKLQWGRGFDVVVEDTLSMMFERVDPFNIYPAPQAMDCQSCSYIIEHHRLMPADLEAMIGVDGFDDEEIYSVLGEHRIGGLRDWVSLSNDVREILAQERDGISNGIAAMSASVTEIDALEFYGQVQGRWLSEHGVELDDDQLDRYHEACVWLVGSHVIKAVVNENPLRLRPYYSTGAEKKTGAFWHDGIPDLMEDSQDVVNASVRNLVNNMGMSSGPQVWIDASRKVAGADYSTMHPWKMWQFKADDRSGANSPPMQFFQPSSNAGELVNVTNQFMHYASETSGVSAAMHGSPSSKGAAKTASGQAMLLNSDMQLMRSIVYNVDIDVIEPVIYAQFIWNMLYGEDDSIKGDVNIKPRGVVALIVKEQLQLRRGEFLANTANPIDMQIIGKSGRASVLREVAKGLDMPVDQVVPSREQLERDDVMAEQMAKQQQYAQEDGVRMPPPLGG